MKKTIFNRWIKVLRKVENRNKEMLKNKKINKNAYILLNKINLDKYCQIIKQYQAELK